MQLHPVIKGFELHAVGNGSECKVYDGNKHGNTEAIKGTLYGGEKEYKSVPIIYSIFHVRTFMLSYLMSSKNLLDALKFNSHSTLFNLFLL